MGNYQAVFVTGAPAVGKSTLIWQLTRLVAPLNWHTVEQADRLQQLQTNLALQYGVICGCPVFVIDASKAAEALAQEVHDVLSEDNIFL